MIKDILKELCALNGVSGNEGAVRDYIAARVKPYAAEMTTDAMGNLLVFVKGQRAPKQKVMLAAHMDEVGIIITGITEEGYLKFDFAGGVDRRVVIGKRVSVGDKAIPGVIAFNAMNAKIRDIHIDMEGFADELNGRIACEYQGRGI